MINKSALKTTLPAETLQFYDNYIPALEAGNYFITVKQTLNNGSTPVNIDPLATQQEFIVATPQFTLDPTQIINKYPPEGSAGLYGQVLPHIVLKDPMLAWERGLSVPAAPWIALLVFEESELKDGSEPATKSSSTTIADFLQIAAPTLAPKPVKGDDVDDTTACHYIKIPVAIFQSIIPRPDELPYLSHVRKVETGNRALKGLNEHGLFSVTASNRFASAPDSSSAKPIKNIVHLVSLEGMENYLAAGTDLSKYTEVALISLASWVFLSLPYSSQEFRALAENIVNEEKTGPKTVDPTQLWLRLPAPTTGTGVALAEATQRIADGYTPLAYHTRSGEDTFAWYRGPLTPLLTQTLVKSNPFFTADAALIYDKTFGVFDVSLAAAWEVGREAALSDPYFGKTLLEFRKKAHRLTDTLYHRLTSDHFTATQIDQVDNTTTVQDSFLASLTPQLIKDIGATANLYGGITPIIPQPSKTDPVEDAKAFLAGPEVQAKLAELIADDLAPIAEWLGRLMLLYPIPFNNLVPDERLLPVESLRFFYIDTNWLEAAVDGALSLGLDSSRQTFFSQVTKGIIYGAAMQALAVTRAKLEGTPVDANPAPPAIMSGFLLRSALVSGWPNLIVKAQGVNNSPLKILRLDHLSSSVLFCILDGVPDNIEFGEPPESLKFGVDDDGNVVVRNLLASGAIGQQLGTVQIRDLKGQHQLCMRSKTSRVLNIAPADNNGLIKTLVAALQANGSPPANNALGPATFAIQMIKSAEAIVFSSQP